MVFISQTNTWFLLNTTIFFEQYSSPWRPGGLVTVVTPRMLLLLLIVLILEFESSRGEILNLLAKMKKKKGTAESAQRR